MAARTSPAAAAAAAAVPAPHLPLRDRVAIVTGGSRGIGAAIVSHLASLGANVVINYASNSARADLLAASINSGAPTPRAVAVRADVSEAKDVAALFDRAEEAFGGGPVQILVHSAGVVDPAYPTLAAASPDAFDGVFRVNARGAFLCLREGANRLARGGGGRIVAVSSSSVGRPRPGFGAYAASKAAVETMVRILAKELAGTGITANCVAPGPISTEMWHAGEEGEAAAAEAVAECPLGRLGQPADVAPVVGFLVSDAGEWINGQVVRANGGVV